MVQFGDVLKRLVQPSFHMYSLDVPAQFGLTSGDVQRTVSADVETVIPMSLEPFSLVANGVQEPVLYVSISFFCVLYFKESKYTR